MGFELTVLELELLTMLKNGLNPYQAAKGLFTTVDNVSKHIQNIYYKIQGHTANLAPNASAVYKVV